MNIVCKIEALSEVQKNVIVENLEIVEWAIYKNIHVNEKIQGLGYDDLYQVGCLALCHAAATYNGSTKFETYAQVVVKNKLLDHCRAVLSQQPPLLYLDAPAGDDSRSTLEGIISTDSEDSMNSLSEAEILKILDCVKTSYNGVTLKGIEAIELKIKGYTGKEIAELYGVKSSHVGAWISRAASKLRKDPHFLSMIL